MAPVAQLTLLLALFAATIVLGPLAERLKLPYPILMLVFGLLVAFVPGLPRLEHQPRPDPAAGAAPAAVRGCSS